MTLTHSPQEIRQALSKERLGGTCLLNMCAGGETLLSPDVLRVAEELLKEGHYVMIVTNGSISRRFEQIRDDFSQEIKKRLFIKFSFHYLELSRLGMLERFFENVRMMREAGVSFTVELTTCDEIIPRIEEIKRICLDNVGALPHVTIARDDRTSEIKHLSKFNFTEYKKIWSVFDSSLFDFKTQIFYQKRKEFCYAGDYVSYLNLSTGDLYPCHGSSKRIGNIFTNKKIEFKAIGKCPIRHCYNGHVWLAFGAIPELQAPCYSKLRDKIDTAGNHWLQPDVLNFFSTKTSENNAVYNGYAKRIIYAKNSFDAVLRKIMRKGRRIVRRIPWLKK